MVHLMLSTMQSRDATLSRLAKQANCKIFNAMKGCGLLHADVRPAGGMSLPEMSGEGAGVRTRNTYCLGQACQDACRIHTFSVADSRKTFNQRKHGNVLPELVRLQRLLLGERW